MEIEIKNRIHLGPLIGVTVYPPEEGFEYTELTFYLIVIDISFKW